MKALIDKLDSTMKRIFYVKDEHGEFVKVRIIPIPSEKHASHIKFQVSTGNFVGILEKDKRVKFHCNTEGPHRLLHNIAEMIKRYYLDIVR